MAIAVDVADLGKAAADPTSTTIAFTTTAAVAAGGFIVASVGFFGIGTTVLSVAGGGLTWTIDKQGAPANPTATYTAIASAQAPAGLASGTTITATFSAAIAARSIAASSFTGVATSSPVDTTNGPIGSGASAVTPWTTGSTAIAAGSLLIATCFNESGNFTNTPTAPSLQAVLIPNTVSPGSQVTCYRIESSAGSYTVAGTWSTASKTGTNAVAYRAAGIAVEHASIGTVGTDAGGTTQTLVTTQTVGAGSFIVLAISWWIAGNATVVSVTGGGLAWSIDKQGEHASQNPGSAIARAYAPAGLASGTNIVVTYSTTVNARAIGGASFTGVKPSSPVDTTAGTVSATSVAAWSTGSVAIQAGSLLVGVCHVDTGATNTITAPSIEAFEAGDLAQHTIALGYRIESSAGSYAVAGTWSTSSISSATNAVAYLAGAAEAGPIVLSPSGSSGALKSFEYGRGLTTEQPRDIVRKLEMIGEQVRSRFIDYRDIAEEEHIGFVDEVAPGIPAATLAGSAAGVGATTGTLQVARRITGTTAGVGTATGTLRVARKITGTSAGTGATTGKVTTPKRLSGTAAGIATATGSLRATPRLSGTSAGLGATTGTVRVARRITGTAAASGAATGALKTTPRLSGLVAGASIATGTISFPVVVPNLSGTAAGVGTATGTVRTRRLIIGTTVGVGTATGALRATPRLTGSVAGVSTTIGTVRVRRLLVGTTAGSTTATGALRATPRLSGLSAGVSTATGTLRARRLLTGTSSALGTATGILRTTPRLSGTTTGTGLATGSLVAVLPPQRLRPDADLVTTGWTVTPLYPKISDESDATVITAVLA